MNILAIFQKWLWCEIAGALRYIIVLDRADIEKYMKLNVIRPQVSRPFKKWPSWIQLVSVNV